MSKYNCVKTKAVFREDSQREAINGFELDSVYINNLIHTMNELIAHITNGDHSNCFTTITILL